MCCTRAWRSFYSLRVLDVHRQDFAKIGVADDEYIRQGIRLLVAVLIDKTRPVHPGVFTEVFKCLTSFLQGMFTPSAYV